VNEEAVKKHHVPFPEEDNGSAKPPEQTGSYTMVDPRFREVYFQFYKESLEGHIKKAIKFGASREEISETIAIAMGVNAAAVVDLTDIAADNLGIKLY
jgi:AhpD family alkylhydroperoxidase